MLFQSRSLEFLLCRVFPIQNFTILFGLGWTIITLKHCFTFHQQTNSVSERMFLDSNCLDLQITGNPRVHRPMEACNGQALNGKILHATMIDVIFEGIRLLTLTLC